MGKLKVGQRIELVQVLTDGGYKTKGILTIGSIRPVVNKDPEGSWVDIMPNRIKGDSKEPLAMFTGIDSLPLEVKPVGAMIVRKLHKKPRKLAVPIIQASDQ
jgi:hypothetical protein